MVVKVKRAGKNIKVDTENIESNCSGISFVNQGATYADITAGDSPGTRRLKAGEAVFYFNENPNVIEETVFKIVFEGGAGDIYIEKEFKTVDNGNICP